jgi:hypothetical protein
MGEDTPDRLRLETVGWRLEVGHQSFRVEEQSQ